MLHCLEDSNKENFFYSAACSPLKTVPGTKWNAAIIYSLIESLFTEDTMLLCLVIWLSHFSELHLYPFDNCQYGLSEEKYNT